MIERERSQLSSHDAVADSMMVMQNRMLEKFLKTQDERYHANIVDERDIEDALIKATRSKCELASTGVIAYLLRTNPQLFTHMMLLGADGIEGRPFYNPGWEWHAYFLVQDKKGIWFAGSPANHTTNTATSSLTTLYSSPDINKIINNIEYRDGGEWPEGEQILSVTKEPVFPTRMLFPDPVLGLITVPLASKINNRFSLSRKKSAYID